MKIVTDPRVGIKVEWKVTASQSGGPCLITFVTLDGS
jgi:hypothetical protein